MQTKFNITMRNRNAAMANKRLDARSAEVRLLQPWQMEVILLPWQMEVILQIAEAHRSASTARRRRNAGSVEGRCFVATASESSPAERRRLGVLQPRQAEAAVQGVQADRSRGSSRTGRRGAAAGPDSPTGAVASAGRRATVSDWQQGDGIRPRQPAVAGTSIPQAARRAQPRRYRVGDSARYPFGEARSAPGWLPSSFYSPSLKHLRFLQTLTLRNPPDRFARRGALQFAGCLHHTFA